MSARILIGLLLVVMVAGVARPTEAATKATEQEVAEALTCQCGCGLTVANCNHPNCEFSVPMRGKIDAMLAHGEGRAQIIAFFRHQYGEKILSAPTTKGFDMVAWVMPFVAIFIGGVIVVITAGRWRASSDAAGTAARGPSDAGDTPPSSVAPTAADSELRRRLERELKDRL
ncbi:MAG: cytochrome c-type biogenesis protein [Candidatus Binataceae bacterium]